MDILDDLDQVWEEQNLPAAQEDMLDALPTSTQEYIPSKNSTNKWDPRLILDLAIGVDSLDDILLRYNLTESQYSSLTSSAAFKRELSETIRDVRENGASFIQKAKIQAESYLPIIDELIYSQTTDSKTKLEAIRSTVKWGGLEPGPAKGEQDVNATQVNVNISF